MNADLKTCTNTIIKSLVNRSKLELRYPDVQTRKKQAYKTMVDKLL